jgi:hypothetical protein
VCAGIKSLSKSFLRVNRIIKPVKEPTRQTKNTIYSREHRQETDTKNRKSKTLQHAQTKRPSFEGLSAEDYLPFL